MNQALIDMEALPPISSTAEVAKFLGCSAGFLNKARVTGAGPQFVKMGKRVTYTRTAIANWLESRTRKSTSDTGVAA